MENISSINDRLQDLFNKEDYDEALVYLNGLISIHNINDELLYKVYYHIGRIYFYQKELKDSKKNFINALKMYPSDYYSKIFLSKILEIEGDPISSMKILKKAYIQNKKFEQLLFTIQDKIHIGSSDDNEINDLLSFETEQKETQPVYPKISIIILCYNKLQYTEKCLTSLFLNTTYENYEVIVLDNASADDTPGYLESYGKRIKYIRSNKNMGFVNGNNYAAKYATGEYLLFLNNDTEVKQNWLNHLYDTFIYHPEAGAVGAMLLYPDGRLQEAGGTIFQDANGWNYGKNSSIQESRYNFVREVDYCSGAVLMLRKTIFEKLNGFDKRYSPAYFEDSDLCFGVRKLGYKVYYNPLAKVVHYEGGTAGTDLNSGFKKHQLINMPKFKGKWESELKIQYPNNPSLSYIFANRKKGKRVLIIDDWPPLPDKASGTRRMYFTLKQMIDLGWVVTYVHLVGLNLGESTLHYFNELKILGVELVWFNYESWFAMRETPEVSNITKRLIDNLELKYRKFDLIYLSFWWVASLFIDDIRKTIPNTPVIIDTHDIHFIREIRQAELKNDKKEMERALVNKSKELAAYQKADCILTVTEKDRNYLATELKNKPILIMTNIHDPETTNNTFEQRKDLLFVGNFNHTPNEDAVIYFISEIFPIIKNKIPDIKFYVVGNNPTQKIKALNSENVIVTGWVPETKTYLEKARISVVPLRYGAGVKGKVGENFACGLPTVMTSVGAEGMNIMSGEHAFISDDSKEFAEYTIQLYYDKKNWEKFSAKGKELIAKQYSSAMTRKRLEYLISFKDIKSFNTSRAINNPNPPLVSIIIITYNQYEYTKKCLESIDNYTKINYEIIIIDNASSDGTASKIQKHFPEVRLIINTENKGFPVAVNQGVKKSLGEYILLLNNDTIVTVGWIERMIEISNSNNITCIVAPISNYVSGVQLDKNAKYKTIPEMHKYAAKVAKDNAGQTLEFPRVAFLCTLIKKEVIDKIGGLDERFSPGNFEDDDFCLRAQMAGYKTVIAKDVFIHHYGSKSFTAEGKDKYLERLDINKQIFIQKWGADPEEIWLQNKSLKKKNLNYPISQDLFIQYFQRALIQIEEKEFDLALKSLEDSLTFFHFSERKGIITEFSDILNLAGNVSLFLKENEKAKYFFEEELKLTPASSRACLGLGSMFFNIQNYNNAKSMFECAIKNDPLNQKAIENLQSVNKLLGLEPDNNFLLHSNEKEVELNSDNPSNENILLKDNVMNIKSRNNFGHLLNAMELLGHGVEIGVQAGEFSKIIRSSWNGKFLHLVDRWKHEPNYVDIANVSDDEQKKLYLQVVSMFADDPSVSIHKMDSQLAAESFPDNYFDWVYIDADHSYEGCKADLNAWYPKLKVHGIFAGHDFIDGNYDAGNFGVKSAVEEFILDKNVQLNLTSGDYLNSWYFEKPSVAVNKDIAQIHNISDSNPDRLIDEAREFQERKDYKAALSKLTLAESMFNGHLSSPQNADFASAFFSLKGYNYLGDRDYDKAKECFEKALNLNPKSSEACSGLGDLFVLNGDNENAKVMYEWAIKNNPYNNYPKEALEKISFNPTIIENFIPAEDESKHDNSKIRVVLEKILESIFELFNLKEFDEALYALNKNEQLFYSQFRDGGNNDIVSAYENMKGFVYLGLDQIDNAHSSFETALNLNPDSSQSSAGLGEVYYLQSEDEKAKKMFEWSLRNDPKNLFAKAGLEKVNKLLQELREDSSAEQKEEKIREVLEKILNAAYEIFNLKRFPEALKALDENQQLFYSQYRNGESNDIISAYENLKGFIYLGLNEPENARASFETALNLNPDSSQACAGLGEVFYLQSEDEKAKKMFEWSLKNESENLFAKAGLEKVNELLQLKQGQTFNA